MLVWGPRMANPALLTSPDLSFECFKRQLKTFMFCVYAAVLCYFSLSEAFV